VPIITLTDLKLGKFYWEANCNVLSGAIGMVGADYPWPEANERGVSPYPLTGAQKAVFFRDELAKRPVNIRNIQHKNWLNYSWKL
jgi:hypothetical protein